MRVEMDSLLVLRPLPEMHCPRQKIDECEFRLRDIRSIAVLRGTQSDRGFRIGAGVAGGILLISAATGRRGDDGISPQYLILVSLFSAAIGGGTGALIGSSQNRWENLPLPAGFRE